MERLTLSPAVRKYTQSKIFTNKKLQQTERFTKARQWIKINMNESSILMRTGPFYLSHEDLKQWKILMTGIP